MKKLIILMAMQLALVNCIAAQQVDFSKLESKKYNRHIIRMLKSDGNYNKDENYHILPIFSISLTEGATKNLDILTNSEILLDNIFFYPGKGWNHSIFIATVYTDKMRVIGRTQHSKPLHIYYYKNGYPYWEAPTYNDKIIRFFYSNDIEAYFMISEYQGSSNNPYLLFAKKKLESQVYIVRNQGKGEIAIFTYEDYVSKFGVKTIWRYWEND